MEAGAVDEVVAVFAAAVDGLLGLDLSRVTGVEVAGLLAAVEVQRRRLEAVEVRVIGALTATAVAADFGATSVPDLVGGLARVGRGEARVRVQRAVDLDARCTLVGEALPPIHPQTAAALSAGEISGAHVDVITRYLGRIPADVANETLQGADGVEGPDGVRSVFEAAEAFLVQAARHEDPQTLRRSGELLLARLDPDGLEPREVEQERQRCFGIGRRGDPNAVYGTLTDENKAAWQAVLDCLAAPQPGPDGQPDRRSAAQRQHDALLEAALRLLRSGTLPDCGGVPVSIVVRVDADDLDNTARGEPGGIALSAHGDVVDAQRFLRLGDEADLTTVLLTASGAVLDYGHTRRCATPSQRRALTARDGGCCFPGCTRPAAWTQAHHIRAWIDGGPTDLHNLCLLCPYHHRTFHTAGWTVQTAPDGAPQWIPPAWLDPTRKPRRNTAHHLPDIAFTT